MLVHESWGLDHRLALERCESELLRVTLLKLMTFLSCIKVHANRLYPSIVAHVVVLSHYETFLMYNRGRFLTRANIPDILAVDRAIRACPRVLVCILVVTILMIFQNLFN